jgi:hypothetical protein
MDPDPDADPDLGIFVIDLQNAKQNEKNFFFKTKQSKRSHKAVGIKVFLTFFAC